MSNFFPPSFFTLLGIWLALFFVARLAWKKHFGPLELAGRSIAPTSLIYVSLAVLVVGLLWALQHATYTPDAFAAALTQFLGE